MFFEAVHSLTEQEFLLAESEGITFPIHIHRSFEYFEQVAGSTEVTVGEQSYILKAGDAVLIFPLQAHAYRSVQTGKLRKAIFSPDMVSDFYHKTEHRFPCDNRFFCTLPQDLQPDTFYHQKAIAYFICGTFDQNRDYTNISQKEQHQLLTSLLLFVDQNFSSSCQLRDIAAKIGYDYAYASKYFKRKVGVSFKHYVNRLRVMESQRLLSDTTQSMEAVAEACGFSSLRSFDRAFHAQMGETPSNYRKHHNQA